MKKILSLSSALSLLICAQGAVATANAAKASDFNASNFSQKKESVKKVRPFRGKRPWSIDVLKNKVSQNEFSTRAISYAEPVAEVADMSYYDYLDAPDGSVWFYDVEYETESVEYSEWYTEEYIKSYKFTIYDSTFTEIGTISDEITLKDGETKVVSAVLDPALSTFFFNEDDKPEVMVYLAVNTINFTNNYYNKVYSIGGEKDEKGNDVSIMTIEGRCVDAFNAASGSEPENFYYVFVGEQESEDLDADYENLVDFLNSYVMPVTIYAKVESGKGPQPVFTKNIYATRLPGDTTDGIYVISKPVDGNAYFIFSEYEKPYFIDPTGGALNENPTDDNALVIEVYSINGKDITPVSTTKIPVVQEVSTDQLMYTFYSIGSVAWKNDIDMSLNGTKTAPAFLVARDVMNAATYEEVITSYEIYGNDGKLIREIAQDTDGLVVFDDDNSSDPEVLFVMVEGKNYKFEVRGLYSGELRFSIDQNNDGDPLSASCNRMKMTDGSYKYCFEMTYYDSDDDDNEYIRVAWFNQDGSFDRIDKICMGKDVMAGAVNLYSDSLNPYLYDDDDAMEYAVLVKRMNGETTRNEFMVVDDNGDCMIKFSEDDGKGYPFVFTVLPGETNYLMMVYYGSYGYYIDVYELPLLTQSGEDNGDDNNDDAGVTEVTVFNKITFDGDMISAPANNISVYNGSGLLSVKGKDQVSVSELAAGVYVVIAVDSQGNKSVAKILKK